MLKDGVFEEVFEVIPPMKRDKEECKSYDLYSKQMLMHLG